MRWQRYRRGRAASCSVAYSGLTVFLSERTSHRNTGHARSPAPSGKPPARNQPRCTRCSSDSPSSGSTLTRRARSSPRSTNGRSPASTSAGTLTEPRCSPTVADQNSCGSSRTPTGSTRSANNHRVRRPIHAGILPRRSKSGNYGRCNGNYRARGGSLTDGDCGYDWWAAARETGVEALSRPGGREDAMTTVCRGWVT